MLESVKKETTILEVEGSLPFGIIIKFGLKRFGSWVPVDLFDEEFVLVPYHSVSYVPYNAGEAAAEWETLLYYNTNCIRIYFNTNCIRIKSRPCPISIYSPS